MTEEQLQAIKAQFKNIPEGWTVSEGVQIIEGLRVSGNYLAAEVAVLRTTCDAQLGIIERQRAENERLRKGLEFYANKGNYKVWREGLDPSLEPIHNIDSDCGNKARKALEEK